MYTGKGILWECWKRWGYECNCNWCLRRCYSSPVLQHLLKIDCEVSIARWRQNQVRSVEARLYLVESGLLRNGHQHVVLINNNPLSDKYRTFTNKYDVLNDNHIRCIVIKWSTLGKLGSLSSEPVFSTNIQLLCPSYVVYVVVMFSGYFFWSCQAFTSTNLPVSFQHIWFYI
jgi:hypothetical protein